MRVLMKFFTIGMVAILLSACGEKVTVPTGEVARELGTSGLKSKIQPPGAFRLDECWFSACPKLVRLQMFENTVEVPGTYFIPSSDQTLGITVAIQYAVNNDETSIKAIYDRVRPTETNSSRVMVITTESVFQTYVSPRLRDTVRGALDGYTIEQIMHNLPEVRKFVEKKVTERMAMTPIRVVSVTFPDLQIPDVILKAKTAAAAVKAEKVRQLRQIEADMEVEKKNKELLILRARVAKEAAKVIADDMTPEMATFMMLDTMATAVENGLPIQLHPSMFPQNALKMEK